MLNRTALVVGVANKRSLAWSSALSILRQTDFNHVIVTYQSDRFKSSIERLVESQNVVLEEEYQQLKDVWNITQQQREVGDTWDDWDDLDFIEENDDILGKEGEAPRPLNTLLWKNHHPETLLSLGPKRISSLQCDVSIESDINRLFTESLPSLLHSESISSDDFSNDESGASMNSENNKLDALVHCVAYAPADAMKPSQQEGEDKMNMDMPFLNTSKEAFDIAHSVSSYSLLTLAKNALPYLTNSISTTNRNNNDSDDSSNSIETVQSIRSPSITALSYIGSTRAVPNYNIMGPAKASLESLTRYLALDLSKPPHSIRVNAVSAGPVNTLAARGIQNFRELKKVADEERSMLGRGITGDEVGNVVAFLADGRMSSGITGQVLFCDGGYSSYG